MTRVGMGFTVCRLSISRFDAILMVGRMRYGTGVDIPRASAVAYTFSPIGFTALIPHIS